MRILLVEDEAELAAKTQVRLVAAGFVVDHAATLGEAIECVMSAEFRAILLDRRLPDGDGLSLIPVLATRAAVPPVIVLTALDDVPDRVAGLDAGAEDYLIKPYAFEELLARLRVILRRLPMEAGASNVSVGQLVYNLSTREIKIDEKSFTFTRKESAILDALARRAGRIVLRESLEAQVYGFDDEISSNALEAHISRLRKRLADHASGAVIDGVRGVGYMLRAL